MSSENIVNFWSIYSHVYLVCPAHSVTKESRRQEKLQKQKDLGDQEWLNLGLFMSTFLLENSIFPPHAPPRPLSLVGAFTSLVQQ